MPPLPCRRLRILGRTHKVRFFTPEEIEAEDAKPPNQRNGAYYIWSDKAITFDPRQQDPEYVLDTMIHEIAHAIWTQSPLGVAADEETAVTTIASGLARVMIENPKLGPWLAAMAKVAHDQTE